MAWLISAAIARKFSRIDGTPAAVIDPVQYSPRALAVTVGGAMVVAVMACSNPVASKPVVPQGNVTVRTLEAGSDAPLGGVGVLVNSEPRCTTAADGTCEVQLPLGYESCISTKSDRFVADVPAACGVVLNSGERWTYWLRPR
jgi:hypothetical protein